jgi:cytochrome c peroxidase
MLRNIAKTAPYFHDRSVADLQEAVLVMADMQLASGSTTPKRQRSSLSSTH